MRVTVWLVLLGVLMLVAPVRAPADEPGGVVLASAGQAVVQDRVARLEALVAEQQDKIQALQTQTAKSLDAARVDQVKELVQEVMRDSEFRESLFPDTVQVGYDKGFYLRSADEQFLLKINGILQVRYAHYNDQSRNRWLTPRQRYSDRSGFSMDSIHVLFRGQLFGPELTYCIHMVATETGPGDGGETALEWYTWRAFADYKFADELHVKAGLFVVPFGMQESFVSNSRTMFVTRGMANELFNFDRSIGVQVWGDLFDKMLTYQVAVTNGWRNARDRFNTPDVLRELDQNPAITARVVWHAIGDVGAACCESDLEWHEDPALNIGLSFGYMNDNGDRSDPGILYAVNDLFRDGVGGFGRVGMQGTNVAQFGADAHFKYRGLAATWEYWLRMVDVTDTNLLGLAAPYFVATGSDDSFHQQGMQMQLGYFLIPKKVEAVARVGAVWDIGPGGEGVWEYAAGANWYINGHGNKLQFDVTKVNELAATSGGANFLELNDDITLFRLQWQVMF